MAANHVDQCLPIANPNQEFSFKVLGFDSKKQNDNIFYSPSFYSSQDGYKMCISVHANGAEVGEGTHVSVFAHLMKGSNDDSLAWPFTGTVTVVLLNQLEDDHYQVGIIPFPADSVASQRVVDGERGDRYGRPEFISHGDLYYNPDENCQFLQDDTLSFRVSVQDY